MREAGLASDGLRIKERAKARQIVLAAGRLGRKNMRVFTGRL
jgi:hypothetical protein